jgi:drug/metabolite transporter (DMT)-like permease
MLVATALMGLADNFVVIIARTAGLWQFQVTRSAIALTLILALARWQGWRVVPRCLSRVAARSLVMSTSLILYFAALSLMPVAQAVAGLFTAPLFMLLLSAAFFGRRIGPVPIAAVVAGFAGLMLVIRPETGGMQWLSLLPVVAGLIYALGQLATREWCEGEGAATLLVGFFVAMGLWGLVGLAVLGLWQPEVPPGPEGFSFRLWGPMDGAAWAWGSG